MLKNKNSVADVVASDMADLMESEEYQTVFAKTAAKKDDKAKAKKEDKAKKEKDDKKKAKKDKKDDKKPKAKKKASEQLRLVVEGTAKISEILDELGLVKSATLALETLEQIVVEAKKKSKKHKKDKDEEKEDKEDDDEDEEEEDEDENDASDMSQDEGCADDCMADDKDEDKDDKDENDVEDLNLPAPPPARPMPAHEVKPPVKSTTPATGYAKPETKRAPKETFELGTANDDDGGEGHELDEDELLKELGALDELPESEEYDPDEIAKVREELGGLFAEENEDHPHPHKGDDEPGSLFDTYADVKNDLEALAEKKK